MTTELTEIIQKKGLDPTQSKALLENFGTFFVTAHKLTAQAKAIKVTDETQVELMAEAKTLRLQLRKVRTDADKARIALKEGYLRGGQAVQDIFNDIKEITEPEEDRLEAQEKFAEIKAAERAAKLEAERIAELSQYVADVSFYNLKEMPEEVYTKLLAGSKAAHEAQIAAEKQAEADRIAKIKADEEAAETARLQREADFKKAQADREALQKKLDAQNAKLRAEKKARDEAETKLRQEREAKAAQELKVKQEAEAKEKAEKAVAEKAKAQEDERLRQELLAPDKVKLLEFAKYLQVLPAPAVQSNAAHKLLSEALDLIGNAADMLQEGSKRL